MNPLRKRFISQMLVLLVVLFATNNTLFASDNSTPATNSQSILVRLLNPARNELIEDSTLPAIPTPSDAVTTEFAGVNTDLLQYFLYDEELPLSEQPLANSDQGAVESPGGFPGGQLATIPVRTTVIEYAIQDGDTVSSIAETFGISINTVLWENDLSATSVIKPGQNLKILPTTGIAYTVKKGDTLNALAEKTGSDVEEIDQQNNLQSRALIAGERLFIPNGHPTQIRNVVVKKPIAALRTKIPALPIDLESPDAKRIAGLVWPTVSHHINQYFTRRHTGLDLKGTTGSPIYAIEDATVAIAGRNYGGYGLQVVLSHGNNTLSRYGHMSRILVSAGETVKKGKVIGLVGSTGRSTGPHLHFEIIKNGKHLNPLNMY